jgi:NAD(P)-dependent dehydrogenase (short-subunit alcohol dehydrogenase family)
LDGLVNNAGVLEPVALLAEADPAGWRTNIEVNLLGPFYLTHFALPHLRPRRGRVINVSSGAAVKTTEGWSAYSTAKAALNHFTRLLAAEEPEVVAVALRPGVVDTAMQATIREEGQEGMTGESHEKFVQYHEQGQLLPPEKPGRALALLALYAPHEWSGEFIAWDAPRVERLTEHG